RLRFLIAVLIAPHPERARVELTSATVINFFVFIKLPLLQTTVFLSPVIIVLPTSPKSISC
ncbi:TPA: BC10 family protein, partial [Escherichia coli]|nr:BC10 family protein [Escherichia coli]